MKKSVCFTVCLISLGFMAFAKSFTPASHQAVVSIYANDEITWTDEETKSKGLLDVLGRAELNKEATDEEKIRYGFTGFLLNDAAATVYEVLADYGLDLVPAEEVLNCEAYTAAESNKLMKAALLQTPEGYKLFGNKDKSYAKICSEVGAEGLVSVQFEIQKVMGAGIGKNGSMKACVTVTMQFIDPTGKTLKTFTGYADSDETIAVVSGLYDTKELAALYPDVIKAALEKTVSKIK